VTWVLEYAAKPLLMNKQRTMHFQAWGKICAEWREHFWALAVDQKIPHLDACTIDVRHTVSTRRRVDPVACYPSVKAAIDGIVDAGVLDDDDQHHLRWVKFLAPVYVKGVDMVQLTIEAAG
jgi:hypothetical protein